MTQCINLKQKVKVTFHNLIKLSTNIQYVNFDAYTYGHLIAMAIVGAVSALVVFRKETVTLMGVTGEVTTWITKA